MTRVRKNLPPFTLRLSTAFVNGKTRVSTGFLRFFLVFSGKRPNLAGMSRDSRSSGLLAQAAAV